MKEGSRERKSLAGGREEGEGSKGSQGVKP